MSKTNVAAEKYAQFPTKDIDPIRYESFINGAKYAFGEIKKQIDFAAINSYKFPILHLLDYIDKELGLKKDV